MDKLNLLLSELNTNKEDLNYFEKGTLDKIICNKSKDKYLFCLTLKSTLPIEVYLDFNKKLKEKFGATGSINSKITAEKQENYEEYYNHFLDVYSKSAPLLNIFKESKQTLENNILKIELANKAEEMKLESIKDTLEKDLNNAGFNLKIASYINEEVSKEIEKQIEKEKMIKETPKR